MFCQKITNKNFLFQRVPSNVFLELNVKYDGKLAKSKIFPPYLQFHF